MAPNVYGGSGKRLMHQRGSIAIYNGELFILKADNLKDWEKYIYAEDILTSGPLLRVAGVDQELKDDKFYTTRHPRTVIAKKSNGDTWLITIDGRAKEANGMSLQEVQSTLKWLGAEDIINLDGGGSTTMYIDRIDNTKSCIINHPTDNRKFDHEGERTVANAILLF